MRDVAFRESAEFKGLDGQSTPEAGVLEKVFVNAEFDTRFWRCVQADEAAGARKGVSFELFYWGVDGAVTPALAGLGWVFNRPGHGCRVQRARSLGCAATPRHTC